MFDCFYKTYKLEGLKGLYKASQFDELLDIFKTRLLVAYKGGH